MDKRLWFSCERCGTTMLGVDYIAQSGYFHTLRCPVCGKCFFPEDMGERKVPNRWLEI